MENPQIGDLVVLTAGSMRMAVEGVEEGRILCVWCHEGRIGRDAFDARLLKKWEHRDEDRSGRETKPFRPEREGGRPFGSREGKAPGPSRDDRPRGKPGWDGKPREKKFFRKDG